MTLAPRISPRLTALGRWLVAAECLAAARLAGQPRAPDPEAGLPAPDSAFVLPIRDSDLLALDDRMLAFFAARVDDATDGATRLRQIVAAILGKDSLNFSYDADADYSAAETFRRRRGNCVSFSFLAVAAARAHRLDARFCEVNSYPHWDRHGNLITEIRHLNVRVRTGGQTYDLDLLPEPEREAPVATADVVPDARAFAHFYNNRAVLRVAAGDATSAQVLFDRALAADPAASFVWANKGSALLRTDDLAAAERSFDRALALNPQESSALGGLAAVYAETGRPKLAAALEKKAARFHLSNPYYLAFLAQGELDAGRLREAEAHLRRAIRIKDDEADFYALRARVARGLGRTSDAERWSAKAQDLLARRGAEQRLP